jgi:uncharacterized protein YegP (UPF0339 family)
MKIEVFEGEDGWRWRLRADNNEILATSEAYSDRYEARSTALIVAARLALEVEEPFLSQ